jgi:putative spermidine/putrescine transport system substrate-binding protein
VIAHNSEPDLAQKLAAYLLSPEAQAKVLEQANFIPTNAKTQASGEAAQTLKTIGDYMKTAVTVDWDSINENRPRWNERWNKSIER